MRKQGFTLVELLAAVVIMGLLLAIAIPSVKSIIYNAKKESFKTSLRTVWKAIEEELAAGTSFDLTTIDISKLSNNFNVDTTNYAAFRFEINGNSELKLFATGTGKFGGLYACGTYADLVIATNATCDNVAPVITLTGASLVYAEQGGVYVELGAIAIDDNDGDISNKIVVTGSVNLSTTGNNVLTYTVTDTGGNTSSVQRTVTVLPTAIPTVAFGTNGNSTYAKSYSTTVTVSDNVAVNTFSLEYQWTTSTTAPTEASFTTTFTNGAAISTPASVSGGYYLWILAKDTSGNTMIARTNVFNLDNTIPTVAFGTNGNANYATSYSSTVTISDNVAVNTSSLEYQWTTDTNTPTEASFTTTFTNGGTLSTPAGVSGGYYLWILAKDNVGNTMIARSNVFNLDNSGPTIGFGTNGNSTYAKSYSTNVVVSDNIGVNTSSLEYQWTTSTTAPTEASFTTTFINGGTLSTPAGVTGGYYLWILAKDNANNTLITRTNVFNLDNTAPSCASSGGSASWTNGNITLTGTCSDTGGSGCAGNASTTFSSEIYTTTASPGSVSDNAGNVAACPANQTVAIDKTAPSCSSSGGYGAWTTGDITLTGTCSDTGGSGCTGNSSTTYSSTIYTTTAAPGNVSDYAGNVAGCPGNQTVMIDKTPPSISVGAPSTGWYNVSVPVNYSFSDDGAGVTTIYYRDCDGCTISQASTLSGTITFTSERNSTTMQIGAQDAMGYLTWSSPFTLRIDKTKPSCSISYTIPSNYSVTFKGSDGLSGLNRKVESYDHPCGGTISVGTFYTTSNTASIIRYIGTTLFKMTVYDNAGNSTYCTQSASSVGGNAC